MKTLSDLEPGKGYDQSSSRSGNNSMTDKWGFLKLKKLLHNKDKNKLSEETAYKMGENYWLAMDLTEESYLKDTKN